MAEETEKKTIWKRNNMPIAITIVILFIATLHLTGIIDLKDVKNIILNKGDGGVKDAFVGSWKTSSPATYYGQDIDGERYVEYTANFHLYIKQEGKGYLANGWLTEVSYKAVPGATTPIAPLVQNPDGGYHSPLSFDARGYLDPQPGISSLEKAGNKMTITTPLFGGTEKIVLTLVESGSEFGYGDKLYATLSVIPRQAMGEVTDSDIVLER